MHVVEVNFHVAVGRVVVAEHRQMARHVYSGCVHGHQNHGLLLVGRGLWVRFTHEYENFAARIARARCPPLAGVDDVLIAVAAYGALYVAGIGGSHGRLGHGKAGADLAVQQRSQPALLVLGACEACQHLHVAGIRRRAVEHFGADGRAAHDLGQRRIVEIAQAGTQIGVRQKQIPEARFAGPGLQRIHYRRQLPTRFPPIQLLVVEGFIGIHVLVHEGLEPELKSQLLLGERELHDLCSLMPTWRRPMANLLPCPCTAVNRRRPTVAMFLFSGKLSTPRRCERAIRGRSGSGIQLTIGQRARES